MSVSGDWNFSWLHCRHFRWLLIKQALSVKEESGVSLLLAGWELEDFVIIVQPQLAEVETDVHFWFGHSNIVTGIVTRRVAAADVGGSVVGDSCAPAGRRAAAVVRLVV